MRILIFSDIHGDTKALEKLVAQPADLYISAGDLSTFSRKLNDCGEVLRGLGEKCWVIPGNHETAEENADFCAKFGLTDFHRQVKQVTGRDGAVVNLAGLGYSNLTPFHTPGEFTEDQIARELAAFDGVAAPFELVVHFPPKGTQLDEVMFGRHVGSETLRAWVERARPRRLFCGHIHECAGRRDVLGGTECFNVGKTGYMLEI
jgi:Icc-related predicted phosphoesterase